jgi:DNA anti-recombination protein RmuC
LEQANNDLDQLVGVRTKQIQRRLQTVATLPDIDSSLLLSPGETVADDVTDDN